MILTPMPRPRLLSACLLLSLLLAPGLHAGLLDRSNHGEFLPGDEAFVLEAVALEHNLIEARWLIAPGYYLYRHRLAVEPVSPQGASTHWQAPAGEPVVDEHFGEVQIYRQTLSLPVRTEGAGDEIELRFRYQGCAEAGLCYPPMQQTLLVPLPSPK